MDWFLTKVTSGIISLLAMVGLYSAPYSPPPLDFGAQNAVGGERYFLSGSGVTASQTTIDLTKFGYTKPDGTYQTFSMTSFGDLGCGTIQPGNNKGKQEFISFTGITQNSDNTAQLTGISRGLERFTPYAASTTLQTSHAGGTDFVIANSPPCFYENYVTRNNTETITGLFSFNSKLPTSSLSATTSNQFTTKSYVDAVGLQGAPTSTEAVGGIVRLGTGLQMASTTLITDNPFVLHTGLSTSTPGLNATSTIPITQFNGKLNQNFWDLTANYTWTGSHTFSTSTGIGTTTPRATLGVQGDVLVSGTTTSGSLVATSTLKVRNTTVTDLGRVFYSAFNKLLYADNTQASTTLSIQIPGGTLSTGNSLVFDFYFDDIVKGAAHFYAEFAYGTASTTINISNATGVGSGAGTMSLILSADGATNSQNLSVLLMFESKTAGLATASSHYRQATTTAMSQDSTTNKILNIVFNAPAATDTHIQAMQIIGKLYAK